MTMNNEMLGQEALQSPALHEIFRDIWRRIDQDKAEQANDEMPLWADVTRLAQCRPKRAAAVTLRVWYGWTWREVGAFLGCGPQHARGHCRAGLYMLRQVRDNPGLWTEWGAPLKIQMLGYRPSRVRRPALPPLPVGYPGLLERMIDAHYQAHPDRLVGI
jgi:hypothetical protein